MNLQAHSDQPRDLEAGLSLPEHPDVSPVRLILAAYPLADLDEWCRASTDYYAKPEEIWSGILSQTCHQKDLCQRWCRIFVLYRSFCLIGDIHIFRHSRLLAVPMKVKPEIEEAPTDARVYVYTNLQCRRSSVR